MQISSLVSSRRGLITVLQFLLFCFLPMQISAGEAIVFLQPDTSAPAKVAAPASSEEEYIGRKGTVLFSAKDLFFSDPITDQPDVASSRSLDQQELHIAFFPEQDIRIVVDFEAREDNGILNLRGRQTSSAISNFSMTMSQENYVVTLQDLERGLLYKVVGDMGSGSGQVTEYDLTKLPPVFDDMPIPAPQ